MKQGDYVSIYKDSIQQTEFESRAILIKKISETPMLEIWEVKFSDGRMEHRNILKPKNIWIVTLFTHNPFVCGDKAGLATMRDIDVNIRANGWKIVDAKPANSGEGLEIRLEGYRTWISTPKNSDEI